MLYIFILFILVSLLFIWCALRVSSLCSMEEEKEIAKKEEK